MKKERLFRKLSLCSVSVLVLALSHAAYANPEGGKITAGAATIANSGKILSVQQHSDKAVIDWRSFDIQADEHTQFHQPSSNATVLNRVNSNDPSRIMGKLTANGNVVLVNPNGVFFSQSSKVDVNGLIATSADIDSHNFMMDKLHFTEQGNPEATIENAGTITAKEAGLVALVAPNVVNHGVIEAKFGRVDLAASDSFSIDLYGDGLYELKVSDDIASQMVSNTGSIRAEGGTIALTAAAGEEIVRGLITIEGELKAPSIQQKGGKIIISAAGSNGTAKAGESAVLINKAHLDASGRGSGQQGGKIEITADAIGILPNTFIDASGHSAPVPTIKPAAPANGTANLTGDKQVRSEEAFFVHNNRAGGSIKIGGDYLGAGDTPTANYVYVDPQSVIVNDAIESGDGGRTIIWADHATDFYGNVFGRGGTKGGNGGFLETSGKQQLNAQGYADLTAAAGYQKGTYLLDPANIAIYGGVDPGFASTDSSIDLASELQLWLDAADSTQVELTYSTDGLGTTASGTVGTNTITTFADVSANLVVGARIRLNAAGSVSTADTLGADTYTITAISGTTITVAETLTSTYAGDNIYRGLISEWKDRSGDTNHFAQTVESKMPLWVSNGKNDKGTIKFDGVDDYLDAGNILDLGTKDLSMFSTFKYNNTGPGVVYANSYYSAQDGRYALLLNNGTLTALFDIGNINHNIGLAFSSQNYMISSNIAERGGLNKLFLNGEDRGTSGIAADFDNETGPNHFLLGVYNNVNGIDPRPDFYLNGQINEVISFDDDVSAEARQLLEQYQSTKWDIALDPTAAADSEAVEAMSAAGYSAFSTRYLEKLSQSANITLQATDDITLDLQGDNLSLADDKSITLTAGRDILTASTGTITTNYATTGANITFMAANDIVLDHALVLDAKNGGTITLEATGGVIAANDDLTLRTDNLVLNGTFAAGAQQLTYEQGTAAKTLGIGTGGAPDVALSNTIIGKLKMGFGSYSFGRSDGGAIINNTTSWEDPVTFLSNGDFTNAVATTSDSAILVRAGGDVILNENVATTSAAANALVLSAGNDFLNNAGSDALSAVNSRWLVYSDEPAGNTRDGLLPTASEFNKTYAVNAPATIGVNNRFVYATATQPTLTYQVSDDTVGYGSTYNGTPSLTYHSGLVGDDTLLNIGLTGSAAIATTYNAGDNVGVHNNALTATAGTLSSPLGYQYAFIAGDITVTPPPNPPPVNESPEPIEPTVPVLPDEPTISDKPTDPTTRHNDSADLPDTVVKTSQNPILSGNGGRIVEGNGDNSAIQGNADDPASNGEKGERSNPKPLSKPNFKKMLHGLIEIHPHLVQLFGLESNGTLF